MNNAISFALALILVLVGLTFSFAQETSNSNQQTSPSVREIPGLTAEDPHPNGCVDCHINVPDRNRDFRISTHMSVWYKEVEPELLEKARAVTPALINLYGIHPEEPDALKDIPAACVSCHDKPSEKAPPFAPLIHTIHLSGGEDNHFLTTYQGECTHCHKMDSKTGQWTMHSGPEK